MKHSILKRGLSLLLAVLMTVGLLPTQVLAAEVMGDERVETPVIDAGDPVIVDTFETGRTTSSRREESTDPDIDPEEPDVPVDPMWQNLPLAFEIDNSGNFTISITTNDIVPGMGSGNNAFVVTFTGAGEGGLPSSDLVGSTISGDTNNKGLMDGAIAATNLPGNLYATGGNRTFTFAADGSYDGRVLKGSLGSFNDFLASAKAIDPSLTDTIPLHIILVTQAGDGGTQLAGVSEMTYNWKLTGGHLADKTYTLDLRADADPNLTTEGTTWTDADGSGTFTVPIENDGDMAVTMGEYTGGGADINENEYSAASTDGKDVNPPSDTDPDANKFQWNVTIPDTTASGIAVFEIPYSYTSGDDEVTGTATITVVVITDDAPLAVSATGVTFRVKEGFTEDQTATFAVSTPDSTVTGIASVTTGDDVADYGVGFYPPSVEGGSHGDNGYLVYVTGDYGDELGIGSTPYTTVTLKPGNAALVADGGAETTYTTTIAFDVLDQNGNMTVMNVKVTIIVEPGEVEEETTITYDVNWPTDITGLTDTAPDAPGADTGAKDRSINLPSPDTTGITQVTFDGWYTDADCTTKADDPYTAAADATLYAKWTPVEHKVTYDDGDLTVTGYPKDVTGILHGTEHTVEAGPADQVKADGTTWRFTGWKNGEADVAAGEKLTIDDDVTLVAQWEEVTYTVTYAKGTATPKGGSSAVSIDTWTGLPGVVSGVSTGTNNYELASAKDASLGMDGNGLGYTFKEWDLGAPGTKISIAGNVTVTATWEPKVYDVIYNYNGNGTETKTLTGAVQHGAAYTSTEGNPSWPGHTFTGWTVTGTPTKADGNITYTAQWDEVEYTVKFYKNGGTWAGDGTTDPQTTGGKYAETVTEPTTGLSRTGYTQSGWNTKSDGTGDAFAGTETYGGVGDGKEYYAVWTINSHLVKYASDFGTVKNTYSTGTSTNYDVEVTVLGETTVLEAVDGVQSWDATTKILTLADGSKKRFDGWETSDGVTTTVGGTFNMPDKDVTFKATWTDVYTVTYAVPSDTTPGTTGGATKDEVKGATHYVFTDGTNTGNAPSVTTNTGYTFVGWSETDDSDAGTATYTDTADGTKSLTVNSDVTLYPVWSLNQHDLIYDKNGKGDDSKVPATAKQSYGSTVNLAGAMPKWTDDDGIHWVSSGWAETAAGSVVSSVTMPDTDKRVYAIWAKDKHTVSYNKNGTGASLADDHTDKTDECGFDYTISAKEPTWDANHKFLGWATSSAGAVVYAPGDKIEGVKEDITLYAKWQAVVNVTWKTGGGLWTSGDDANTDTDRVHTGVTGQTMPVYTKTDVTLAGYRFKDWTNTVPADGNFPDDDVTFTARWDKEYTVKFDVNNTADDFTASYTPGALDDQGNKIAGEETGALPAVSDSKSNYVFKGWALANDAGTADYTVGNKYTVNAAHDTDIDAVITLYGVWVKKVEVTYQVNGGKWSDDKTDDIKQKGEPNVDALTPPTGMTRDGYTFDKWSPAIADGDKYPASAQTYVAQWTARKYNYIFDGNNGGWDSGATTQQTVQYATDAKVSAYGTNPSRTGYTFKGWTETADTLPLINYADADNPVTMPAHDVTVYAYWEANKHTVTYAPGAAGTEKNAYIDIDGTTDGNQTSEGFTYDGTSLSAKKAEVVKWPDGTNNGAGWNFKHWQSDETDAPTYDAEKTLATTNKDYDIVLTAQWSVDVTFDANLPDGLTSPDDPETIQVDYGNTATIADMANLTNYDFAGWFYGEADDATKYEATDTFKVPTTLCAHWTEKEYTIKFVDNNDNNTDPTDVTDKYNTPIELPSAGHKVGYVFQGWFDKDQGVDGAAKVPVNDDGKYVIKGDATLYAHWSPAEVTVTYLNGGHGTAPTEDTMPDYAGSYTLKTVNDITGGDWSTDGDGNNIFTVTAEGADKGNRYKFNGWDVLDENGDADGQKASGATIDPVDTDNGVVEVNTDGTYTYTLTLQANWTQLFSVTYVNGPDGNQHGTVDEDAYDFVNQPAGPNTPLQPSVVIPAGTGESWNGGNTYFTDTDGKHWRFDGWKDQDGTVRSGEFQVSKDITLTAQWTQMYKVTLDAPALADDSSALGVAANATFGGKPLTSGTAAPFAWVEAGKGMEIKDLTLASDEDDYIFAKWTQDQTGDTEGTFTTKADGTGKADTFTPAADTVLTPNYWKKPTLSPESDWYHLNFNEGDIVDKGTHHRGDKNELPTYVWTQNSAKLDDAQIQIKLDGTNWTDLTVGTDVKATTADGKVTFVFQDTYLKTLAVPDGATQASYPIQVVSHTPNNEADTANKENTTLPATLVVYVTPDPLEKVVIWAKGDSSDADTTANVNADTGRDGVKYHEHTPTSIEKDNKLTYQWYYGPNKSTAIAYHTANAANNATNTANAIANLPSDSTLLSTLDNTVGTGETAPVTKEELKGKYIYAVVTASGTGYGAVITNSIAVDYDAVVKVNKDGQADTSNGYTVYLVPEADTNAASYGKTAMEALPGLVGTTHTADTNQYATADSALTGGKTYDIYVNKVEGDDSVFVKTGETVNTQTDADHAKVLNFYSVNAVEIKVENAQDDSDPKQDVGEKFNDGDVPAIEVFAEGVTNAVPDGNGVFTGSKVTAVTAKDTWTQDYNVDWASKTDSAPSDAAPLSYGNQNQTAAQAKATGYAIASVTKPTWVGARLEQNVYDVTGNIWVNNNNQNAGIVHTGAGIPELTFKNGDKTYVFKADQVTSDGKIRGNVVFQGVPKSSMAEGGAITGKYSITATPKTTPRSTILKYAEGYGTLPTGNNYAVNDPLVAAKDELKGTNKNTLAVDIAKGAATNDTAFTVIVAASSYILTIPEMKEDDGTTVINNKATQDYTNTATLNPPATSGNQVATAAWAVDYAYAAGKTYTVKVVNEGNTTLDVVMNVKRTVDYAADKTDNDGYIYGPATTGVAADNLVADGKDPYNKVSFSDTMEGTFTLAPKGEKVFTVTIPVGMDVRKTADYAFEFTSTEHNTPGVYGPSVTYKLTQAIDPLPITAINFSETSGVYSATGLKLDGAEPPTGVDQDAEVEYHWYVAPVGNGVTLNTAGTGTLSGTGLTAAAGEQTDGTYQLNDADKGKTLYLVAHNQATGNVTSAAYVKVADLAYDMDIMVYENDAKVAVANKVNYQVYLWDTSLKEADGTTPKAFSKADAIQATADATNAGVYTATGLDTAKTYAVYTNAVGGTATDDGNVTWQNSGETVTLAKFVAGTEAKVVYRNVILNNTTVDNTPYNDAITGNDDQFLKAYSNVSADRDNSTLPNNIKAPEATVGTAEVATTDVNKWVQSGTTVALSFDDWERDYKLTWDGVTTGADVATGGAGGTGTVQVTAEDTTVKTQLTLNLYDMPVYVVGDAGGSVTKITLTNKGDGLSFTSAADGTGVWNGTGGALSGVTAGGAAAGFKVPAGTYTVAAEKAAGTTIRGYRTPHNATAPTDYTGLSADGVDVTVARTGGDSDADVIVTATGQLMTVTDNAHDVDSTLNNAVASASYESEAGATPATTTLTLPFGYTAKELTLTVKNASTGSDTLYDVTMDISGLNTESQFSVTAPADTTPIALTGDNDMAKGDTTVAKLGIATGLAAGTYESTLKFSFNNTDGNADTKAETSYTLKVVVKPAEFTDVSITKASGTAADIGTAMVEHGEALKPFEYATTEPNLYSTGLITEDTDYTYLWYATPADKTLEGDWADGVFTPKVASNAEPLTAGEGYVLSAETIADHPGQKIWLVISAEDDTNVIKAAISDPVTTGFQPVVKIAVDDVTLTKDAGKPEAGDYVVTIHQGSDSWNTQWNDDKGGFVAVKDGKEVALDATKEYTAQVSRVKGDATTVALPASAKMTLADPSVTAEYFTVHAVATKAFDGVDGLGETFTVDATDAHKGPTPAFTYAGGNLADGTPVLKDQQVSAKVAGGWTEDYTLTWYDWQDKDGNGTGATPTYADAYEDTDPTMTATSTVQASAAADATGYQNVTVDETTYIGGRLNQNTYTIVGTVKGTPGNIVGVTVEQIGADDATVATYAWPDEEGKRPATGLNDANSNGSLQQDETVTFTVVKGTYTITSVPNTANTVITKAVWEPGQAAEATFTGASGVITKQTVNALSATNTQTEYNFQVHVEEAEAVLGVTDSKGYIGETGKWHDAVSNGTEHHTTNVQVRYFDHIANTQTDSTGLGDDPYELMLENPGNVDLTVDFQVFYFSETDKSKLNKTYFDTVNNWEDVTSGGTTTPAANTALFTSAASYDLESGYAELKVPGGSGETTVKLWSPAEAGVAVPVGAKRDTDGDTGSGVAMGNLELGTDAWSKDSGAFVVRFKGHSDAGDPVVYYVLDLTVNQLPIVGAETQMKDAKGNAMADTDMPGVGDVLEAKGYDATTDQSLKNVTVQLSDTATDKGTAADNGLTDDDVHFAWVSVPGGTTGDILARFQVGDDGVLAAKNSTDEVLATNAKTYTVTADELDKDLYLIAYAPNTKAAPRLTNATGMAISGKIQAKRTVGIQVSLDGNVQPISGTAQPFTTGTVELYLLEDGEGWTAPVKEEDGSVTLADGVWATTWSNDANKVFQAAVDMGKVYHVYAPTYQGSSTYVDTGKTVGKDAPEAKPVVPYFSVEHTADVTVRNTYDGFAAYLPDSTQTGKEDNAIQDALTVMVSTAKGGTTYTDTLTGANVPVLSGMNVKVTVDAAGTSANTTDGVKKSWSEAQALHTLTAEGWENGTANAVPGVKQTGIAYPAGAGDPAKYLVQSGDITITDKQNFKAELAQKLFDVTFNVVDNTPAGTDLEGYTPGVKSATLTATETGVTLTLNHKSVVPPSGADGAVVTFEQVPAGAFEIAAVGQTRTNVDGYTWNATGDDLDNPITPGKIVNVAGGDDADDTNKHAGNTIQIQYSSNSVNWMDNFDVTNGKHLADNAFVTSDGFDKVNTPTTGPWLALKEGYKADDGDVLTYTVRVVNDGATPLENFKISQTSGTADLIADLTAVRVYDGTTGTQKEGADGTANVTTTGFTLAIGDWVEFEVTIPEGQAAKGTNYTSNFKVESSNSGKIAGGTYDPAYQVRPDLEFQPGKAKVLYGGKAFEENTDITDGWQTSYGTKPTFAYDILTEAELAAYLTDKGETRPANAYTKDGTAAGDHKKPEWLVLDAGNGAVTFDGNLRATGVNVQTKNAADFKDYEDNLADRMVDNEVILYVKITDEANNETYYTTYTVNVEPGQLKIVGDSFAPATSYIGQSVDKGEFTYTNVTNQIDEDVVAATDIAGDGNNTANGNTAAKDGTVTTAEGKELAWSVDPTLYAQGVSTYTFTVTYEPKDAAEKWNYKFAEAPETVTPEKPPMDLLFSDTLTADHDEPAGSVVQVRKGTEYSDPNTPDVSPEVAPGALGEVNDAFRKGEEITYLDVEPRYNVTLKGIGDIYGVKIDKELVGFEELDSTLSFTDGEFHAGDGTKKTFALELTPMPGTTSKYVGIHTATYIVTGYASAAEAAADPNRENPGVKATYTLTIEVKPKVIAEAHVTDLTDPTPGGKPDTSITVTAKDPEGKDIQPGTPDKHGNKPITPDVKWTPTDDPFQDGKDYTVEVKLTADPNYVYEDKTVEPEEPNYTAGDTDPDPSYNAEVTHDPKGETVVFTKTTPLPKKSTLMFDDKKTDGGATSAQDPATTGPQVNDKRGTIVIQKGQKLGKYEINLGAYDNEVTDVVIREAAKKLPGDFTWTMTASPDTVGSLDAGAKQSYTLDMTGVDTTKVAPGDYTLKLEAEGNDPYGTKLTATYELTIRVEKVPAPTLKFDDVNQAKPSDTKGPDEKVERTVTVTEGGKLGKYTINLGSYGGVTTELQLALTTEVTSGESIYKLMDDCTATKLNNLTLNNRDQGGNYWTFDLDLSDVDTSTPGTYTLVLKAIEGMDLNGDPVNEATYTLTIKVNKKGGGGGGGGSAPCPYEVSYWLGLHGTTTGATGEQVSPNGRPSKVPTVNAMSGYKFLGWSLSKPVAGRNAELVDPTKTPITSDTVFYAVYESTERPFHEHYVIGYPNGNFGPDDDINRASVATIIARAVLPDFKEGADYGNPGNYSDVSGHWAESAIAYCSQSGVFKGYEDGTFRPDQPITRQEFALVIARLAGLTKAGEMPFSDIAEAGPWALDGIYTAYAKGWVVGYTDGTFRPLNNIRRDEAVKIFNGYLYRGVDASGLSQLKEYIHTGVASNLTENGTTEYMTWPDVPKTHWAYFEIIEAANDHEYATDETAEHGYKVPEFWEKCWIDQRWRYHDDLTDGGPTTQLVSSGFRLWANI